LPRTEKSSICDLQGLSASISGCRICVDAPHKSPLPHQPRPVAVLSATARLAIVGQAPGARVHATGIPFNDPSGDRLRDWMQVSCETFYDASRVAIVPMGFCFPGHDRNKSDLPPRTECRAYWHDLIFDAMPQLEVIVCIGAYAQAYHLPRLGFGYKRPAAVTAIVANWREYHTGSPKIIALPHPSWRNTGWLRKNPWFETDVLPVLRAEVRKTTST
jgi:uracil-DNA glycosylase